MNLLETINVPQESVNDDFLTLLTVAVKNGDHVTPDMVIAELETSKAVIEVRTEKAGYIISFVKEQTDVKIGSKMFEIYDEPITEEVLISLKVPEKESLQKVKEGNSKDEQKVYNTKFSKAALAYLKQHKLNVAEFAHLEFVTTKDIITVPKLPAQNITKAKVQTPQDRELEIKKISSSKKIEYDYLYSVNSSSVISRISTVINLKSNAILKTTQHFIYSTPLPSVIQEVSKLLVKYPNLNSYFLNGEQAFYTSVDVGFALDDGKNGLKVATIFNSNTASLEAIEEQISELSLKYAGNKLSVKELTSSTFTITDLFNTNTVDFHPLVNNNNSAILGISGLSDHKFKLDLSFDHRVTSGKEVSQFLDELKYRLDARFYSGNNEDAGENIKCFNCLRELSEDLNGKIFFQKVINSRQNGYICSNCLNGY